MTLADDIITELLASWSVAVIAKPTLNEKAEKADDKSPGIGWVWSGQEDKNSEILGTGAFGERITPFEIYIPATTETNYDKYYSETDRIISAKSVSGGYWEITGFLKSDYDQTKKRHNFHCTGAEHVWS